jgi:hypothetical protein
LEPAIPASSTTELLSKPIVRSNATTNGQTANLYARWRILKSVWAKHGVHAQSPATGCLAHPGSIEIADYAFRSIALKSKLSSLNDSSKAE